MLLAEPDALKPAASLPQASIPKPARLQAPKVPQSNAVGDAAPQQPRRKGASSLFDAMQQDAPEDQATAGELFQLARPSAAKQPKLPAAPSGEPLPEPRKRKAQLSAGSDSMGPPATRKVAALNGEAAAPRHNSSGSSAPQRTASGSLQTASGIAPRPASTADGAAARDSSGGNAARGPAPFGTFQRSSSGSQRGSSDSQASLMTGSPSKRVAAITLVEVSISVLGFQRTAGDCTAVPQSPQSSLACCRLRPQWAAIA